MTDFGTKLKQLRESRGLSQKDLADKLNLHKNAISNYELGKRIPTADVLRDIAIIFNVSCDYLLGLNQSAMLPIDGLNQTQVTILSTLVAEFLDKTPKHTKKLTQRQESVLSDVLGEFSTERD